MWFFNKKKKKKEQPPIQKSIQRESIRMRYECSISGLSWDKLSQIIPKNPEYNTDYETLKEAYAIGEKIYEYEYVAQPDQVSLIKADAKYHVLLTGQDIGYLSPKRSADVSEIEEKNNIIELRAEFYCGCFRKIVKNDSYYDEDDEDAYFDPDDPDCKWVDNDQLTKPKGSLTVVYANKDIEDAEP